MLVSLYTSRVVLGTLGVEDFGIYSVVGGVIVLFSFISGSMGYGTQRFLTHALGKGDKLKVAKTFSVSMSIHIGAAFLILLLGETVGLWFLNSQLNLPTARIDAVNWVYQFSVLSACIGIVQVPYNAVIIANEKMSVFAYLSIAEALLKLGIVYLLTWFSFDKLKLYAILMFFVIAIVCVCYKIYCNQKFKESLYKPVWDKELFKLQMGFSGWTLFTSAADVSMTQGVNMLLNVFYGVAVNAAMGIANQVNNAVNSFVQNFQVAFMPQIIKSYAANERERFFNLIIRSSKFSFLLLFALSIPLILNMELALKIWLKTVPEYAVVFCELVLIDSLVTTFVNPMTNAIAATGNIKNFYLTVTIIKLLIISGSFVFLSMGMPPTIVLFVKITVDCFLFIARALFLRSMVGFPLRRFASVLVRLAAVSMIAIPLPLIVCSQTSGLKALLFSGASFEIVFIVAAFVVCLDKRERCMVKGVWSKVRGRLLSRH
ncbi:hypothetical protein AGMMS49938_04520 [Fibrobacterales bacterium]|nr:hypothetical protein AGMMS49938_04520 [Fibrobacterales bacterium]